LASLALYKKHSSFSNPSSLTPISSSYPHPASPIQPSPTPTDPTAARSRAPEGGVLTGRANHAFRRRAPLRCDRAGRRTAGRGWARVSRSSSSRALRGARDAARISRCRFRSGTSRRLPCRCPCRPRRPPRPRPPPPPALARPPWERRPRPTRPAPRRPRRRR
jgi:pilus assembly protein CpaC